MVTDKHFQNKSLAPTPAPLCWANRLQQEEKTVKANIQPLGDIYFMQKQLNTYPGATVLKDLEVKLGHFPDQPSLNYCQFDNTSIKAHTRQTTRSVRLTSDLAVSTQWGPDPQIVWIGNVAAWAYRDSPSTHALSLPICRRWDNKGKVFLGLKKHYNVHQFCCS